MAIIGAQEQHVDPRLARIAGADTRPWYRKPNLRFLYLVMLPTALGVEWTSGFDSSMMNSLQAVKSWSEYFDNPNSARLGLINAIYSLGALVAIPLVPTVSQLLGRRRTIQAASLFLVFGAALQAASQNTSMFIVSRFLLGLAIPFAIVNGSALIAELSYERERPILTSLFGASWFVGAIAAAGTTYGTFPMTSTWSWRLPSLLQLIAPACQLLGAVWCPESPRWLVAKDRGEEAMAVLRKYHSEGDDGETFVALEYAEIQATIAEGQARSTRFVWADAVRDAPMRRRFALAIIVGVFSQWSGNGLLSFYMKMVLNLVGITDERTVQQVILANTCWGFITALPIALIAPRYPRRKMFLTCTIGTAFVYTVWTVASARFAIQKSAQAAIPVLVFIFVYSPFYNIGWNALSYTYVVEVFPFQQRAQGVATEQLAVRLAVFFNTYVNPIALDAITWKYYIVYCVWILVEIATVYTLFPETYNRSLEELSFIFEGKGVQDKVQNNVNKVLEQVVEQERVDAKGPEELTVQHREGA